ncbi:MULTISPECIES: Fe-S cluster assembly protein SufD [Pseudanabaena]|uniref:Fe-S cluster assembly protein SufD n=1 Tax=Pseudanabaena TaxID=1152 RepID=UPI002479A73A|nr:MULTISPECIES: Fe-S cluster assembly protein SufD [Pseudanabaena]MEA5485594.1 Fe-S cluster assembly protein SufD [Pseudanabaena sp. CCNP1317]WGS70731.1 Fe-S cluster assembly protein SufD [Pseudanabaena galeata CCNP1313]
MAIQVSEQLEDQVEFKGALSTRSKLAVNSEQFVAQVVALSSDIASTDKETSDFVGKLRQLASDRLEALAFPTTKDEEWKYTDVSALGSLTFANQQAIASRSANLEALIANNIAPESLGNCLVFVNGKYRKDLSDASNVTEGLVIGTLATLGDRILPKLRSHLAQHPDANDYFASLNTACMEDVAIILAPKNLVVENPVQLIFISAPPVGASTLITQPRCLVIAESHSELTFVQTFVGENHQAYFTNAVTEVWLAEGAQVNHTKVQRQGNEAIHINTTAIAQAKNSVYKNQSISFGAKISRQNLIVQQMAAQTETSLTGLAFLDGEQLADTHSVISHNYPHGSSKQLHKCIADGRSHAVFNGKIQVAKLAQQTDSAQLSRNLLLSGKARVDTKPQLEIFADNVKCAHGATVSQLDADEIFYLQSRAIDAESAANLLTYAFATEAISQIPVVSIQRSLSNFVLEKTKA